MNIIDFIIIPLQIIIFFYTLKKIATLSGFLKNGQESLSLHDYKVPIDRLLKETPQSIIENKMYSDFSKYRSRRKVVKEHFEEQDMSQDISQKDNNTTPAKTRRTKRTDDVNNETVI